MILYNIYTERASMPPIVAVVVVAVRPGRSPRASSRSCRYGPRHFVDALPRVCVEEAVLERRFRWIVRLRAQSVDLVEALKLDARHRVAITLVDRADQPASTGVQRTARPSARSVSDTATSRARAYSAREARLSPSMRMPFD